MKIFISWSSEDDKSRQLAVALKGWLPLVVPTVKPWISCDGMPPGSAWAIKLLQELKEITVGLVCITKQNQNSRWIQFEAGAIACSSRGGASLTPILLDLHSADLKPPLELFNWIEADKKGFERLVKETLNPLLDEPHTPSHIEEQFEAHWPKMERKIEEILNSDSSASEIIPVAPEVEKLNEILSILRLKQAAEQQQILQQGEWLIPVDTRPLQGAESPLRWLTVNEHTSVSQFADDLFGLINGNGRKVARYSYGTDWEIRSENEIVVFPPYLDSPYLSSKGAKDDMRPIGEIGIDRNIRLIVTRPHPQS